MAAAATLTAGACTGAAPRAVTVPSLGTLRSSLSPSPSPAPVPTTTAGAFVRVDQVGYDAGAPKRAYLMAPGAETGAVFRVVAADGSEALTGPVGADLGRWSRDFPHVYAVDFDAVTRPGAYEIVVDAPIAASSTPFRVDAPANVYAAAVANALAFYHVQRDGPDFVPSALRTAAAHLHDEHALTYRTPATDADGVFRGDLSPLGTRVDASGGWWDAGDYLKFVHATSYTVALLLLGVRDYPNQMGPGSPADFTDESRFGLDWLLRMWDDRTRTLYYQVGIGSGNDRIAGDHDVWRLPQEDDTYGGSDPTYRYLRDRPVFRAGPPGSRISPNLAGRLAAAFALCFQVFRSTDAEFADRCLIASEHVFDLADTSPRGRLVTAIPYDFYPEVEWRDDLELGAAELATALAAGSLPSGLAHADPSRYLRAAAHWARAYLSGPNDAADTLNLYDVSGIAHDELDRAITGAGDPGGLEVTHDRLRADLRRALDGAVEVGRADPFGFGYAWNQWDTTTHGVGLALMAVRYDELTGSSVYADVGRRWLGNVLGANAWGSSFIVGDGTTFPHCLQHQVANLAGSTDGSPPVLAGAVVEGPNSFAARGGFEEMRRCPPERGNPFAPFDADAVYKDNVQSYSTVEPAVDLTATSPLVFAALMAGAH